jgi:hypothetical protein
MTNNQTDYGLEFLLAFNGRIHHLEDGCWIKFEIKRVRVTVRRPHGLSYAFSLHAPDGRRLLGFDNAHRVRAKGSRFRRSALASDHWHRTENDAGRPYVFTDADTLLRDFFAEVRRILTDRGESEAVIRVEQEKE